jgi:hypothetical protein
VLTATAVSLVGALYDQQIGPVRRVEGLAFETLRSKPADSEASRWLDRAVQALHPDRVSWLETALWQKVTLPDLTYQARGRLLLAPEGRFRLELGTQDNDSGQLEVSDGSNRWTARRAIGGEWVELTRQGEKGPLTDTVVETEEPNKPLLSGGWSSGLGSLLSGLSGKLRWVLVEPLPGGQIRLTGLDLALKTPPPTRPAGLKSAPNPIVSAKQNGMVGGIDKGPRICRVILDGRSLWPDRIEWWGPIQNHPQDRLMVEMEFREPILNRPLAPDVCAREFSLRASNTVVTDLAVPFFPTSPETPTP